MKVEILECAQYRPPRLSIADSKSNIYSCQLNRFSLFINKNRGGEKKMILSNGYLLPRTVVFSDATHCTCRDQR